MSKLSYEDKVNLYNDKIKGIAIKSLGPKYGITYHNAQYLIRLIDKHGFDILRTTKNKTYSSFEKERIINRVLLNNESIMSVSINEGLPSDGMLCNWILKYKENGYNIVERKRGRPTMPKVTKKKENETDKENVGIKENEKSEKSTESEADQELQEENINLDITEHAKAEPEITAEEIQEEIFSKEVSEEIPEKVSLKDRSGKISEETFQKEVSEKISQELQDAVSQKERPKETDEEISQKETAGKSENENEIRSAETENKCQGCEPGTDTRWNRATARYIHFQPVQDEKIEDAIRIQPSDLKILWQKGLRQGSNSFLMHGYYQHQHLMIGKGKEGGYILGILGFYGEKNMAEMFGFPEFRRAKTERTSEIKEQTFGYWCKNLI